MHCPRCDGLLIDGSLLDIRDELGKIWIKALQCLNCGEILDPVILRNRQNTIQPFRGKARLSQCHTVSTKVA